MKKPNMAEILLGSSLIGIFLNPASIPFALVAGFSFAYLAYEKHLENNKLPDIRQELQELNAQKSKEINAVREEYIGIIKEMKDEMGKMALSLTKTPNLAPRKDKQTNVIF